MNFISPLRAALRFAPIMALPLLAIACEDGDSGSKVCGAGLSASINVLVDASGDLNARADGIANGLRDTCEGILTDLQATKPARTGSASEQAKSACDAASAAITSAKAGATITVAYSEPRCHVNAQAQIDCEARCTVDASCQPGSLEARCEPGEFSVECNGSCEGSAQCTAEANGSVTCNGSCNGVCDGECSGGTNAQGQCQGTCNGECRGTCEATGSASAQCEGEFRCEGSCTGTASAPRCEAELTPPACEVDADCNAGCTSNASVEASCEPGFAEVTVAGTSENANIEAALENALPRLLQLREQAQGVATASANLAGAFANVTTKIGSVPACAAAKAAQFAAAAQASASAVASISVSVNVSASVSGSAGVN